MGYSGLLSNKSLLVNDTMRHHVSSTSSGSHRLSIEKDVDIKLHETLGKYIVFALCKVGDLITNMVSKSCTIDPYLIKYLSHRFIHLHLHQLKASNFVGLEDDREVETLSCTSSSSGDEIRDCLFYDDENTNLNPRYGLDRVDTSGACKVRCSYSSYVYQYSISISASILVCTITDFNFNS